MVGDGARSTATCRSCTARRTSTRASTTTPGAWSAATSSSAYSQYIGNSLLVQASARASISRAPAKFFKDAFFYETESTAGEYFTGDRELSPVRSALIGGKLTVITRR